MTRALESTVLRGTEGTTFRALESYVATGTPTVPVISETFTGTDGAPWPMTNWASLSNNGTRETIQSNKGQVVTGTAAFDQELLWLNQGPSDFCLTFDLVIANKAVGGYFQIQYRQNTSGGGGFPGGVLELEAGGSYLATGSLGAGNTSVAPPTYASGDIIHWKVRVAGPVHQVKLWINSDPEPSAWTLDALDTAPTKLTGAGQMVLVTKASGAGGATTYTLDNIVLYDTPDPVIGVIPPPVAALYSDDFNRADGALGAPWVVIEGGLAIVGNHVTTTAGAPNTARYDHTFAADQWAEADVTTVDIGSLLPIVRINGADLYYLWMGNVAGVLEIWKRVGGSYSKVGSSAACPTSYKARLEAEGTTLRAYINGTLAITATDSSIATGQPGMLGSDNSSAQTLDNWRSGDMPYVPIVYSDDFGRVDTTSGTGGLGAAWNDAEFYISGNKVKKNAGDHWLMYNTNLASADNWIEVDVNGAIGGNNYITLAARCTDTTLTNAGKSCYFLFLNPNGANIEFGRLTGGGYAAVSSAALTHSGSGKLRLECEGTTLRGYWNGSLAITATDSSVPAGNFVGISWRDDAGGVLTVDNFRGGALPYTP